MRKIYMMTTNVIHFMIVAHGSIKLLFLDHNVTQEVKHYPTLSLAFKYCIHATRN